MGLRDLHLKLKAFRLKRFVLANGGKRKRRNHDDGSTTKKPSWMMPVSHGCHVIGRRVIKGGSDADGDDDDDDSDSVVVQREQIENAELWYFGIFDCLIGDVVTKYMQSHFFNKQLKESHISKKCKETVKRAYLGARAKIREEKSEETCSRMSSASVFVINGEKLVIANMGNYKAVVCRDGIAYEKTGRYQQLAKRHWTRKLFSVRILACESGAASGHSKSSELVVGAERIDSDTEFLILASHGIWEVMKNQEAVNLIRHIGDPQEAAECLAKEALIRMSRSKISCIIIRFD